MLYRHCDACGAATRFPATCLHCTERQKQQERRNGQPLIQEEKTAAINAAWGAVAAHRTLARAGGYPPHIQTQAACDWCGDSAKLPTGEPCDCGEWPAPAEGPLEYDWMPY